MLTRSRCAIAVAIAVLAFGASCSAPDDEDSAGVPATDSTTTTAEPPTPESGASTNTSSTPVTTTAPPPTSTTDATAPPPGAAPAGCAASDGDVPLDSGRHVVVRGPATDRSLPAIVVLHGYTGSPATIERTSGMTGFARSVGALVAYPQGTATSPEGFGWATGTARFSTSGVDDVAFLDRVVELLVAEHCVDPARIVLTGESNGGAMSLLAGCAMTHRPALVAPVIPAIDDAVVAACRNGPAVPLLAIAGTSDTVIPYDGTYPAGQVPLLGQEAWFRAFASSRNGCTSTTSTSTPGAETITGTGCSAPTTLVAVTDGHHTWPGGPSGTGGLDPGSYPASATIWEAAAVG